MSLSLNPKSVRSSDGLRFFRRYILTTLLYGLLGAGFLNFLVCAATINPDSFSSLQEPLLSPLKTMVPVENLFNIVFDDPDGLKKIKKIIDTGVGSPNFVESAGQKRSLLEILSYAGEEIFVSYLLTKGAFPEYVDDQGHNALYMASSNNKTSIVKLLINHVKQTKGTQAVIDMINTADKRGVTSLHIASVKGYDSVVEDLLKNRANVDQDDVEGRTALHFSCYMGYEEIVRHLLGHNARVDKENKNGLKASDFFKLGELKEDVRRSHGIVTLLENAERRIGLLQEKNNTGKRQEIRKIDSLREFMDTFQRKCGSIFLAYRTLESGVIQNTKDTLCASNVINILGNVIPLPGAGIVTSAASSVVAWLEDAREIAKRETLTTYFVTIGEMERAVEQSAYELTCFYEEKIRQLTIPGAQILALCAVGRFIDFMRNEEINKQTEFSNLVLESVSLVKSTPILDLLPWTKIKIETQDRSIKWTEQDVFQGTSSFIPVSQNSLYLSEDLTHENRSASFAGAELPGDSLPKNSHKKVGVSCCNIS